MKKLIAASIAVMFAVTGCNTVKGFGKDVSKTGDAVTNTAQKTQNKIKSQIFCLSKKTHLADGFFITSCIAYRL